MLKKHIEVKAINEEFILQLLQHFIREGNSMNHRKKAVSRQIETALQFYLSKNSYLTPINIPVFRSLPTLKR
jgi:hypothetical protein